MRKLYVYCGVMLCLIACALIFLSIQPRIMPLDQYDFQVSETDVSEIISSQAIETEAFSEPPQSEVLSEPDDLIQLPDTEETVQDFPETIEEATAAIPETEVSEPVQQIPYIVPRSLTEAMEINPDVYAWITIPGTNIDYPVIQSPTNDSYYLRRDIYGQYLISGMIMTEHTYNTTTFEDPVTMIYGHAMTSGIMFGKLQSYYSSQNGLEDYKTIQIDLPDKQLIYEVFAAVPYDTRHILYNYDFSNRRIFRAFFNSIAEIRSFNAYFDSGNFPTVDDKVVILSTCLMGDSTQRFLVMAKRSE